MLGRTDNRVVTGRSRSARRPVLTAEKFSGFRVPGTSSKSSRATPTVTGTRSVKTASRSATFDHPVSNEVQRGAKLAMNALCWSLILYQPVPKKDAYAQCTAGSDVSWDRAGCAHSKPKEPRGTVTKSARRI